MFIEIDAAAMGEIMLLFKIAFMNIKRDIKIVYDHRVVRYLLGPR